MFFLSSIAKTPEAYVSNILMGEYLLGLLPKGTHEYELLISPETVQQHIGGTFETIDVRGVTVKNPLTMEMGETTFTRANYMMVAKYRRDL